MHAGIIRRAVKIAGAIYLVDLVIALGSTSLRLAWTDVLGNLLLAETAFLFILGVLVDLGGSFRVMQVRKAVSNHTDSFSKRREAGARALMLLVAGSILLVGMIVLAGVDLWNKGLLRT